GGRRERRRGRRLARRAPRRLARKRLLEAGMRRVRGRLLGGEVVPLGPHRGQRHAEAVALGRDALEPRAQGRRLRLALRAHILDAPLDIGERAARLLLARARLLEPLLEAPALGEQRARALLQLPDLVARALLLVLERLDCALGAGERGAGALGLRVRRSACLLGGPGSGQRPLEVV